MQQPYFVYILECSDKAYYVGLATNLNKDVEDHNNGVFGFTHVRKPVTLLYYEVIPLL